MSDIIQVLAKYRNEVEVTAKYVKSMAEWHSIEKFRAYLTECDKKMLLELIESMKKKYVEKFGTDFFEELSFKFGLREGLVK